MSAVSVTFQDLYAASKSTQQGSEQIDQQLGQLRSQLSPIHSTWTGAAKGEFDRLWEDWARGAQQLRESLNGISQLLNAAAQNYENAETENLRSMQG